MACGTVLSFSFTSGAIHPAPCSRIVQERATNIQLETLKGGNVKKFFVLMLLAVASTVFASSTAFAQGNNPMVGGAAMYRTKDIIDNAVNSADHTTLVAAVKAAGLVETLKGKGPFTVFAPTNAAFEKLPQGAVASLLKPENKEMLARVLTYHVVAGRYDSKKLMQLIKKGGGSATLKSVSGGTLTARMNGMNGITLTDEKGGMSNVTIADVYQSNGVIHVVDTVVMPN
jgi:uncharacterized surface protein with fasciclin (FAS1) repeats